jgi:hypothetical protein
MININTVRINKYIIIVMNQENKWNIGRWTARGIPRKIPNGCLKATPQEVLEINAKRVSESDASRGLEKK